MIDIENEVFTVISQKVLARFPRATLYPELVLTPSKFPCVCAEEIDNFTVTRTLDSRIGEHHANVTHEVNVYSNKASGKKAECKAIMKIVDSVYMEFGFVRTMLMPTPTNDHTKYRLTARYKAVVSENKTIYRR